jgi:thioesterase domain-containing protein
VSVAERAVTVPELLAELRRIDARVVLEGDRLKLSAPAGALTEEHRRQLAERKAEIVEFLRSAEKLAQQQKAVVPLQPLGTRVPIFGTAGHNGDVFCYRALAHALGEDQPFYGLQPPGLDEGTEPLTTIEDLARYFAGQIRELRGEGPIAIAGFCAGGTIAFELARQLSESGVKITRVILFGAPYSTSYRAFPQIVARSLHFARRMRDHLRSLVTLPADERRRYFAERLRRRPQPAAENDPVMLRRRRVEETTVAAIRKYEPRPFGGHVDLMLPCESWTHSPDVPLRWARLAKSSTKFLGPEGCSGDTMLLPDYAPTFAAMVEAVQKGDAGDGRP